MKLVIIGLYTVGILLWLVLWRMFNGYALMRHKARLLWFPFFMALAVLMGNLVLETLNSKDLGIDFEEGLFNFLDQRTANVVSASSSMLVIATIIYGVDHSAMPKDFLRSMALSFICFIGISTPILWIPANHPTWLRLLRHYQTISFTYGLFFAVSGIIVLLDSLGVRLPESGKSQP
jgi:hypothetical protein